MVKKVLVVDDSETIRQQVRLTLAGAGFAILEAVDGIDGLEKIRLNGDLALIISDVNMPRMTGLEMVTELQRLECRVPILMLTTEGQVSLIQRARAAGAKGWLVKPFKPEILGTAVSKLVRLPEGG
jgi:two-component system chemotaxis response regulator CheY